MVTTRKQAEEANHEAEAAELPDNLSKEPAPENSILKPTDDFPLDDDSEIAKRDTSVTEERESDSEPPAKKVKIETPTGEVESKDAESVRQIGTTERGYIYFFFRPKVETNDPSSIDDVKNLHMLLVPRPPKFSTDDASVEPVIEGVGEDAQLEEQDDEMHLVSEGEDAVPARPELDNLQKHYRLVTIGKKTLPDPELKHGGRKESFWATVTAVGDDLDKLEEGMGEKTYETKTRGVRHDPPARLVARGCYAIVNSEAKKISDETTYLGYALSHPAPSEFGPVQNELGIQRAGAFILQVKNPETSGGMTKKTFSFPAEIMQSVFGKGSRGREAGGLKFAPCSQPRVMDYTSVELLLVAVKSGEDGLEEKLGEGRGEALTAAVETDEELSVREIFQELWGTEGEIPEALNGEWI